MIKSMTGYGKAIAELPKGKLTIEIRTLNGKTADVSIKSSLLPKDKELAARAMISSALQRGTIDVYLTWEAKECDAARAINAKVAESYIEQIRQLARNAGVPGDPMSIAESGATILASVLRMPDVLDVQKAETLTDEDWPAIEAAFAQCLENVCKYRADEGVILYRDITSRVEKILGYYTEVKAFAVQRTEAIRERILKAAEELQVKLDKERFEQEMIFYLEKLDINEEKVRLRQHCKYFMDTIDSEPYPGKKLGFIIQEMGREINTTGSKANHADIQQLVVKMKDELEKMREQSMNVL